MRLQYLVANAAWVFVFGDDIVAMGGVRFFESRREAVRAAKQHGLVVATNGVITTAAPA